MIFFSVLLEFSVAFIILGSREFSSEFCFTGGV